MQRHVDDPSVLWIPLLGRTRQAEHATGGVDRRFPQTHPVAAWTDGEGDLHRYRPGREQGSLGADHVVDLLLAANLALPTDISRPFRTVVWRRPSGIDRLGRREWRSCR